MVVVEGTPSGAASTASSVKNLRSSNPVQLRIAPAGAPLTEVLAGIDAEWVLLLRAGSTLSPTALSEIAQAHYVDPQSRVVGFDSDLLDAQGKRHSPRFRPTWSPELLLSANYLGRAVAVHRSAVDAVAVNLDDRGVWELLLATISTERDLLRLPRVLLSEPAREAALSAADADMVRRRLEAGGEAASVTVASPHSLAVRFQPEVWPSVSIIIPTRHSRSNLARLLPTLAATDYPLFDVHVVDNGGESAENRAWYDENRYGLDLTVAWWTEEPFNYSRVNNVTARASSGDVLVFLNDDTEIIDPGWLRATVGHALRRGVGTVGLQMQEGSGRIQHAGVVIGPGGFADNLFAGVQPGRETLIGRTEWSRNTVAVTGACVTIRREFFEAVGGFDERFILTGSDVVLGLDQLLHGRRNVVLAEPMVRHFESITRGRGTHKADQYASYWRYIPWLTNGDPYFSPNLSPLKARELEFPDPESPTPVQLVRRVVGVGGIPKAPAGTKGAEAYVSWASITAAQVAEVHALHAAHAGFDRIESINWFLPNFQLPYFGGVNTAFRLAAKLARDHGVRNRFIVFSSSPPEYFSSAIAAAQADLAGVEVLCYDGSDESIADVPVADAAVATLWLTAHHVAKSRVAKRKFYLVQDFEPVFHPAGTMYALAEESYRLGLYGICNSPGIHRSYTEEYGGTGMGFVPAVDRGLFHPEGRRIKDPAEPVTIFVYSRDRARNCWELVEPALARIKQRHGERVRILVAGMSQLGQTEHFTSLGVMDYRATGAIYRETDIGLAMQVSRHPSYLPLELMASGVAVMAPDSGWFDWLFDESNSLVVMRSVDDIVEKLDRLVTDARLRTSQSEDALATIARSHSDWDAALASVYDFMNNPEGEQPPADPTR